MKKNLLVIVSIFAFIIVVFFMRTFIEKITSDNDDKQSSPKIAQTNDFDFKIINQAQKDYKENYMISPLSIAYALTILKEGASDNTRKEIETALNDYKLPSINNIKDRISLANLLFINSLYQNDIKDSYINSIRKDFDSDVLFGTNNLVNDVNNWISKKTFNMINDAIDSLDNSFVIGIANAIAIDVEWKNKFDCSRTRKDEFNLVDNTKLDVSYMNGSNDVYYIESDDAKGIIKDYNIYDSETGKEVNEESEKTISLEYIAIMPNGNIDDYIKSLNYDKLNKLYDSKISADSKLDINYSIPKYTYDFDYKTFKNGLINLGINDAFSPNNARFNNIVKDNSSLGIYVDEAIHKSHIEFNENGTKAAAVTIFIMKANAFYEEKKSIDIKFDKPFIYIIKEKNKNNIWFFGIVYEPDKYTENNNCKYQ